jgi:hypothetical protein
LYYYYAYTCLIESVFPFPEFVPVRAEKMKDAIPDITICYGEVPGELNNPTGCGELYQASLNQFLLKLDHIASYLVLNGNKIIVQPAPDSIESDIRVFLLGSCIGALLHQRGVLALHASGIGSESGAVLFTGVSGAGKSTLLGELLNRGCRMMVDDVCAVVNDNQGVPTILPAYPRTRLWADSAQKLSQDITEMPRTRPSMEKYERQASEFFWDTPAPLRRIYHLTNDNNNELRLLPMSRFEIFNTVRHNTYRQIFLDGLEMRKPHFDLVSSVTSSVTMRCVVRPNGSFLLKELADLVMKDMACS